MPLRLPNFALYAPTRTELPALAGRVDGFPVEEHRLDLGTTEHPIESGSTLTDNAVRRRTKLRLEGWVSDILPAPGNEVSADRAAETWGTINELFERREQVTVVTALRTYENMLIARCIAPVDRTTGRALRFTMDLIEVLFSDTELVRFSPAVVDEDGPAAARTSLVDAGDKAARTVRFP